MKATGEENKAISLAREAAQAMNCNRAMIILIDKNGCVISASWGATLPLCRQVGHWLDDVHDWFMEQFEKGRFVS